MKKVININFQGVVVPIEEDAYEIIKKYINDLRIYFAKEEGKEEIINDIESRIGELFQAKIKEGAACITEADANRIIDNMGRVKDFEEAGLGDDEAADAESRKETTDEKRSFAGSDPKRLFRNTDNKILGGVCSGIGDYIGIDPWIVRILFIVSGIGLLAYIILWIFLPTSNDPASSVQKKFYRNPDDKIIGGVCGGIASYFGINAWIPRVIFLIPFINSFRLSWINWQFGGMDFFPHFGRVFFSPTLVLVYIILWIVIPEAKTTSEKLQMKGEKVNLNSIKESVSKEMNRAGEGLKKAGNEAKAFFSDQPNTATKTTTEKHYNKGNSGISAIGQIIVTLIKVFLYIIAGTIIFALLMALLGIGAAGIGLFPLKNFIIPDGIPNILAWLTLILLILVPIIAIIAYIVQKLANRKSSNPIVKTVGFSAFILGIFCLFGLGYSISNEFRSTSDDEEHSIQLTEPRTGIMEIKPIQVRDSKRKTRLRFSVFSSITGNEDSVMIGNVRLKIYQSPTDEFMVKYATISNGKTKGDANDRADKVKVTGYQEDSTLYLSNTITINKTDQFRNQMAEIMVFVPIDHRFKVDRSFGTKNGANIYFSNWDGDATFNRQYTDYGYRKGVTYIMTKDGPKEENTTDDKYEYSPSTMIKRLDSLKEEQEKQLQEMDRAMDSIKEAREKKSREIEDSFKS